MKLAIRLLWLWNTFYMITIQSYIYSWHNDNQIYGITCMWEPFKYMWQTEITWDACDTIIAQMEICNQIK